MKLIDKTGNRYGKLVVVCYHKELRKWECNCDCGNKSFVNSDNLSRGRQISCGCHGKQILGKSSIKHHKSGTRLFGLWAGMLNRVRNPNYKGHKYYKHVTVCDDWKEFIPFERWAMANGYTEGLQLDRINNNLGYHPDNCQFLSGKAHGAKTRRDNKAA